MELLVTITILVILASVTLYAMFGVQQMAKVQRAKAQVQRLHEIVAAKWESFESRRLAPTARTLPPWFYHIVEPMERQRAESQLSVSGPSRRHGPSSIVSGRSAS